MTLCTLNNLNSIHYYIELNLEEIFVFNIFCKIVLFLLKFAETIYFEYILKKEKNLFLIYFEEQLICI